MKRINLLTSRKPPSGKAGYNILKDIHVNLGSVMVLFRALLCDECKWGMPTYCIKFLRGGISNEEKEACRKILDKMARFVAGNLDKEEQEKIAELHRRLKIEFLIRTEQDHRLSSRIAKVISRVNTKTL